MNTEIKDYIKNNLKIDAVISDDAWYGKPGSVEIRLMLEGEPISECFIYGDDLVMVNDEL